MLHTKFQVPEAYGSEKEDFLIFLYAWFQPSPLGWGGGHFGPWDLRLNELGVELLGNPTYQISSI